MSIMQLVKKKKGKKRPGYRGDAAYGGGGDKGDGPASGGNGGDRREQRSVATTQGISPTTQSALGVDRSAVDQFSQFGRNVMAQNLNPSLKFDPRTGGMRKPFLGGLGSTIFGGILSLINPALGLAFRGFNFLKDKVPQTLQDFQSSNTLEEFRDKVKGYGKTMPVTFNNPNFDLMIGGDDEEEKDIIAPMAKPTMPSLSNELIDFEQGQTISPLQARDGGRIQYMNGGLTDLVDIYD